MHVHYHSMGFLRIFKPASFSYMQNTLEMHLLVKSMLFYPSFTSETERHYIRDAILFRLAFLADYDTDQEAVADLEAGRLERFVES